MNRKKIVVIGAGSASFGLGTLAGIMRTEALHGLELDLVDINEKGVTTIGKLAGIINDRWGCGMKIKCTTDRREVLKDADFVIISIAIDREKCWRSDYEIALKHGISHYAENGGPAGFIHSARNISEFIDIFNDINKLCPGAFVLNFSNPMMRLCQAINVLSDVPFIGMCHQIYFGYYILATLFAHEFGIKLKQDTRYLWNDDFMAYHFGLSDAVRPYFDIKAAGINHFTCMLDIRSTESGKDMMPEVRNRFSSLPPEFEPLTQKIHEIFDFILVQGDSHIVEYVPYASILQSGTFERYDIPMYDFDWGNRKRNEMWHEIAMMIAGTKDVSQLRAARSERAEHIIAAIVTNGNCYEETVNIPNSGNITNLPDGAMVEVPGNISASGVTGLAMGDLPEAMAEICRRQQLINDLSVEAVIKGDIKLVYQLFALDPMVTDLDIAVRLADEYISVNREYLPTFH